MDVDKIQGVGTQVLNLLDDNGISVEAGIGLLMALVITGMRAADLDEQEACRIMVHAIKHAYAESEVGNLQ